MDQSVVERYRKTRALARGTDSPGEKASAEKRLQEMEAAHPGIRVQADAADRLDEIREKVRDAGFDPGSQEAEKARKRGAPVPSMSGIASMIDAALADLPPDVDILDVGAVIDHVFQAKPGAGAVERAALAAWRKLLKKAASRGDLGDLLAGFNPFGPPVEDDMATTRRRTRKNGEPAKPKDLLDLLLEKAQLACDDPEDRVLVFEVTIPAKLWEKVQDERKGPVAFVRWVQACLEAPAEDDDDEDDDEPSSNASSEDDEDPDSD